MSRPWWWTFTDVEISMIASHLAAGGSFCCKANADARCAVTSSKRKQDLLAEHAYEGWGCYGDSKEPAGSGAGSRSFAGEGPYFWVTPGMVHTKRDTASKRDHELGRAAKYFKDFLDEISPRFTLEQYNEAKRNVDYHFKVLAWLDAILPPVTVNR